MILRCLQMNLHQMKNTIIFMIKEYIFWLQTAEKVSTHQSHKKHKKLTSPVKGPTSPVGENISSVRELSLSLVREGQSPVSVTSKTGMKQQGENNHSEKRKQIRQSEDVFNQYASQTDGYDSEFERESQSMQSMNFDKIQKIDNQCEMPPLPLHEKMRIMSSNQRKGDVKLATLQKSLVKVVAGTLNIFTEIQKDKFEIQTIAQMVADITAIVGKVSYDLSLKRRELIKSSLKPEFRSLCSANNEPTELLLGDDLTKHVKDLTMTNKLKRSESYYQSKYSNNK